MAGSRADGLEFRLLGPFEVAAGDRIIEIGSRKQRMLLAMLILRANQPVTTDALVEQLWAGAPPASVAVTLPGLVSRLRRALAAADAPDVALRSSGASYVLQTDPARVDAHRLIDLVRQGRHAAEAGSPGLAAVAFRTALALRRGPTLGDLADLEFARVEAARLDETCRDALEDLAQAELDLDRPGAALAVLEPHVKAHPLRERACGQLMIALYREGRQSDALAAYQELRRALRGDLGLEPTPALRRIQQQILAHSPELEFGRAVTAAGGASGGGRAAGPAGESAPPFRVPAVLTPFVGRGAELAEVGALLGQARLLTLTGIGGTGKTRLALELAGRARVDFPDGVWVVELAQILEPGQLVTAVLETLGIAGGGLTQEMSAIHLRRYLRERQALLVLDNCEHLVEAVADLVEQLLAECQQTVILTTSREVLGVAGEISWPVPGLSLPAAGTDSPGSVADSDAASLFVARARAVRPGYALTAANAAAIERICRSLDGIPLAIELAAARSRVLSAHQLAERLEDMFRVLTAQGRTATARHQTLRAAMDWSYELLPPHEQALLRLLSIFPQSFDLDAAESVAGHLAGSGVEILDWLTRLVDKSLVVADVDSGRYHLLETVRQYGTELRLAAGEESVARDRHRDHYTGLARAWQDAGRHWREAQWTLRYAVDYENLRAALDRNLATADEEGALLCGAALTNIWAVTGRWDEVGDRLTQALAGPAKRPSLARIEALVGQAVGSRSLGARDLAAALAEIERIGIASDDVEVVAQTQFCLGATRLSDGDRVNGRRLLELARDGFQTTASNYWLAWAYHDLGWVAMSEGAADKARALFAEASDVCERAGRDILQRAHVLAGLAVACANTGDLVRSQTYAEEAVRDARRAGRPTILVMALTRAAEAACLLERYDSARVALRELLALHHDIGMQRWVANALEIAGLVLADAGRGEAADRLLGNADTLRRALGEPAIAIPELANRVAACRARLSGAHAATERARLGLQEVLAEAIEVVSLDSVSSLRQRRTFMFTDIVGSTQLAETLGDGAWSHLLRSHDDLLRSIFTATGGEVIKHTGDGFFAAFERPADAIRCAVNMQQALDEHRRRHGFAPQIRLGVHEADATRRGDDYEGRGIHEAARIGALAGADEILVSAACTAGLHEFQLSNPRALVAKGLSEPIDVVTVLWHLPPSSGL